VKENQPELLAAITDAFDDEGLSPRERRLAASERQIASSVNKGHGRTEKRTLTATPALNDYLDWPFVGQAFKLVRERTINDKTTTETVFGITSASRQKADAPRLLKLVRSHWMIENGVFYVRDMTFGEDACRVRTGCAPMILSTLRNAAITLLNQMNLSNKAAVLRRHAAHPNEALALIRAYQ
jgi:predicted transposase YbfD/YdcC